MKKTLIASAIAAASVVSANAVAAEATVYGNIQLATSYSDAEATILGVTSSGNSYEFQDNGSTIGLKGSHEIAPGLEGFFKAELEFDADDKSSSNGLGSLDEAYVGLKGDFGKVWGGSDDTVYEDAINYNDYFEFYGVGDLGVTGEGDMIQYSSPSFGGLVLSGGVQINGEDDDKGKGSKSQPFVLTAAYSLGDSTTIAVGVDSNDGVDEIEVYDGVELTINNENAYGISVIQKLDALTVSAAFETVKDGVDKASLLGVYSMGANNFALAYEFADFDNDLEVNRILAQALHNLSDNMYVYIEGEWIDAELDSNNEVEQTGVALGATYVF
ncbi:porin [Marinobacter sp. SS21]|uniref:porin n=1 Tax=Marinobacter sp. SS21 TaxID=2979460 RepID=UPI00232B3A52|nr:porin [Marinobacter sp. SS21]MDC0663117.1 porin [Marinobacter sp. SS21]